MDRANSYGRCVYTSPHGLCSGVAPLHQNEHYLPAGLGNFRDDIHLRNFICCDCQARFCKYELVFLQNSPEAFFRKILGYKGRAAHAPKNIFVDPTHGIAPLTLRGPHPSFAHDVLLGMDSQDQGAPLDQVIFERCDGSLEFQPIRPNKLLADLGRFGTEWETWKVLGCISKPEHEEELRSVFGSKLETMRDVSLDVEPNEKMTATMNAVISLPYIQAVSKIVFHFVLARFHFNGFEPEFDDLKRFIYEGTGQSPLRTRDEPLLPAMAPESARLRKWSHVLTAEFDQEKFIARMQFFAGPRLKPPVLQVDLGKNPSRVVDEMSKGFLFSYYSEPDASGYLGSIEELTVGPQIMVKK